MKTYRYSTIKALLASSLLTIILALIISQTSDSNATIIWANKSLFQINHNLFGILVGLPFGLILFFFLSGQQIFITDKSISYSSNILALFIKSLRIEIPLEKITEVILGFPRSKTTQIISPLINIRSEESEITIAPGSFSKNVLHEVFLSLKRSNPNIIFDLYSSQVLQKKNTNKIFNKLTLKYFIQNSIYLLLTAVIAGLLVRIILLIKSRFLA